MRPYARSLGVVAAFVCAFAQAGGQRPQHPAGPGRGLTGFGRPLERDPRPTDGRGVSRGTLQGFGTLGQASVGGVGFGSTPRRRDPRSPVVPQVDCIGGVCSCGIWGACTWDLWFPLQLGAVMSAPEPVPVYYPLAIPVPVAASWPAPPPPSPPPVPYDPTKSRMVTIGTGSDGGGGVLAIERPTHSALMLTWRGSARPTREVRLFLADSLHRPIRERRIPATRPSARFDLTGIGSNVAFAGVTVVYANGSIATTLVPVAADQR